MTHVLTGMCLARCGLFKRVRYATMVAAVAAEFPDADVLWGLRGPVSAFQHHRGITHTLLGVPLEAAAVLAGAYFWNRARSSKAGTRIQNGGAGQPQPREWWALYMLAVFALLSHILLDFTNNYGVRPFFPFYDRWYAASIVFIFDPLIFLVLAAGLTLPLLFALINQEIGQKGRMHVPSGWAAAALFAVLGIWALRALQKNSALAMAMQQVVRQPGADAEPETSASSGTDSSKRPLLTPLRAWASPDPLNPFRWYVADDFGSAYLLSDANTRVGTLSIVRVLEKAPGNSLLAAAAHSRLGRIYLDWSAMPWLNASQIQEGSATRDVRFEDVRFMNSSSWLQRGPEPPLTGDVLLDGQGRVLREGIGGRFEP